MNISNGISVNSKQFGKLVSIKLVFYIDLVFQCLLMRLVNVLF